MRLRLIDGKELTKLMVRYNVGVQVRETFGTTMVIVSHELASIFAIADRVIE